MPIKINGKDVKNIKLTSNSVTRNLKKVGISGKVLPVWESNRTFSIAFDLLEVARVDYSLDGKRTWIPVYGNTNVSVPVGTTVYWYAISKAGFEEATPNEDYWALDDNIGTYPGTVYKCTVGSNNLELTLGAVAIPYKISIPENITGIKTVSVFRVESNFGQLGVLNDSDDIYKDDRLQISMTALPGYRILDGKDVQTVYVTGNYTVTSEVERESYT